MDRQGGFSVNFFELHVFQLAFGIVVPNIKSWLFFYCYFFARISVFDNFEM